MNIPDNEIKIKNQQKIIKEAFKLINQIDESIINFEYDKIYLIENLRTRLNIIEEMINDGDVENDNRWVD